MKMHWWIHSGQRVYVPWSPSEVVSLIQFRIIPKKRTHNAIEPLSWSHFLHLMTRNKGCWYLQWLQFYSLPDRKNEVQLTSWDFCFFGIKIICSRKINFQLSSSMKTMIVLFAQFENRELFNLPPVKNVKLELNFVFILPQSYTWLLL